MLAEIIEELVRAAIRILCHIFFEERNTSTGRLGESELDKQARRFNRNFWIAVILIPVLISIVCIIFR